jgi:hypothetical protein
MGLMRGHQVGLLHGDMQTQVVRQLHYIAGKLGEEEVAII